jgi:hypothetical protein
MGSVLGFIARHWSSSTTPPSVGVWFWLTVLAFAYTPPFSAVLHAVIEDGAGYVEDEGDRIWG